MARKSVRPLAPLILSDADALADAIAVLTRHCRIMRAIHTRTGAPPLRDFSADFSGLCRIITGQQLSATSAAAIWGRFSRAVAPFDAPRVLALRDEALRETGLSSSKIHTIHALATAVTQGQLDIARLNTLPDESIVSDLTRLYGIGPWTAEIYLLFALRRADAFPAGDLALQLSVQKLLRLKERPTAAKLAEISGRWRPFRGAAARLLWAEYALQQKNPAAVYPPRPVARSKVQ